MYKKILVPLDNSKTDETILAHIRPLARLTGAIIVLVHVSDGFGARLQEELDLVDSEEMTDDQVYLQKVKDGLASEGFKVQSILAHGKEPAVAILNITEDEGCDLIAMATHGHRFIKDMILGSVAEHLRHNTNIPILMIRDRAKQAS